MSNNPNEISASIGEFGEENSQTVFKTFIPNEKNTNTQKIVIENLSPESIQPGEAIVLIIHPNKNKKSQGLYNDISGITNEEYNNSLLKKTNEKSRYKFGNTQQSYPNLNLKHFLNKNKKQPTWNKFTSLYERKTNKKNFNSDLGFRSNYNEKETETETEKEKEKEKERNKRAKNFFFQPQDRSFNKTETNNHFLYKDLDELLLNSDSGLYLTLSGFMIMCILSNLLTNALTQQSHIARMVFAGLGTSSMLIPPLFFLLKHKLDLRSVLRLQRAYVQKEIMTLSITISVTLIVSFFTLSVLSLIVLQKNPKIEQSLIINGFGTGLLALVTVSLVPAICEEIVFRGFFQHTLEHNYSLNKSILISSFLFSFMHLDFTVFGFLYKLFLGYFYGLLVINTNSCYPSIIGHMINNALTLLFSNTIQYFVRPGLKNLFIVILLISSSLLLYTLSIFFKIYSISNIKEEDFDTDTEAYISPNEESTIYYEQEI
ncbi:hypothetical protein M0812_06217 [Anaeramoeba flamelloides]|uniref:CAAX prenyl protease 2/Lysostaphin resistance protein A-like domain-containing protein n=1 Tax=Anaeramoeba flamelloides TaxID=1746091 RepID=A0AAV8AB71_9EUKA|nr:hypothetical protein M0812_06217 [Anaeramoeba flamelloides]